MRRDTAAGESASSSSPVGDERHRDEQRRERRRGEPGASAVQRARAVRRARPRRRRRALPAPAASAGSSGGGSAGRSPRPRTTRATRPPSACLTASGRAPGQQPAERVASPQTSAKPGSWSRRLSSRFTSPSRAEELCVYVEVVEEHGVDERRKGADRGEVEQRPGADASTPPEREQRRGASAPCAGPGSRAGRRSHRRRPRLRTGTRPSRPPA